MAMPEIGPVGRTPSAQVLAVRFGLGHGKPARTAPRKQNQGVRVAANGSPAERLGSRVT